MFITFAAGHLKSRKCETQDGMIVLVGAMAVIGLVKSEDAGLRSLVYK